MAQRGQDRGRGACRLFIFQARPRNCQSHRAHMGTCLLPRSPRRGLSPISRASAFTRDSPSVSWKTSFASCLPQIPHHYILPYHELLLALQPCACIFAQKRRGFPPPVGKRQGRYVNRVPLKFSDRTQDQGMRKPYLDSYYPRRNANNDFFCFRVINLFNVWLFQIQKKNR